MKKLVILSCLLVLAGCVKNLKNNQSSENRVEMGVVSLGVRFDDTATKALTEYNTALESEKAVRRICFLAFDKNTGALNAFKVVSSADDVCEMTLPVGEKVIYALVNGPYPGYVTRIEQMDDLLDEFSTEGMDEYGLTLIGRDEFAVTAGEENELETVTVSWLVSRVVLTSVTCNLPDQYGEMLLECVYLGNANTSQTFAGVTDGMVNINGCAADGGYIGQDGATGDYDSYLYRSVGETIYTGEFTDRKFHMYCQPNASDTYTCVYLLVSIDGSRYYYRVPLTEGLSANTTCSVDVRITNLGSPTPPDGDMIKGEIEAKIAFDDWIAGNSYVAEF